VGEAMNGGSSDSQAQPSKRKSWMSGVVSFSSIEQRVKKGFGSIILDCLKRFQEARRELNERLEADQMRSHVAKKELKKEILKEQVKAEEIKRQDMVERIVDDSIKTD